MPFPLHVMLLLFVSVGCGAAATFIAMTMAEDVNRKLPDNEKFSISIGYPGKGLQLRRLHRRFYPESRLSAVLNACVLIGILSMVTVAILLFRPPFFQD